MRRRRLSALVFAAAALAACRRRAPAPDIPMVPAHAEPDASAASAEPSAAGGTVRVAGIELEAPAGWHREAPSSPMRAAQFSIPGGTDEKDASVVVYYFGNGQGGGVAENVERWRAQFSDSSGKPPRPEVTTGEHNGVRTTVVRVEGTFASGMPMGPSTPEKGFALWGAILEGPQGAVFVKATGPAAVIAREAPRFDALLASLRSSTAL